MRRHGRSRRGFSLIEVAVTGVLMVLLSTLLANAWIGLGRPLIDTARRARIAQESTLALACLARDLGGYLPGDGVSVGGKSTDALVGRSQPDGDKLWLCYDGGATPNGAADWAAPDAVITYEVVDNDLVRTDTSSGAEFVVARHVDNLALVDLGGEVEVTLGFEYRGIFQTYFLIAKDP